MDGDDFVPTTDTGLRTTDNALSDLEKHIVEEEQPVVKPRAVEAQPPETIATAKIGKPKEVAAGPASVMTAARRAFGEMGVARSLKVLSKVNQKGGFDCPGCAWPDPDDRSGIAEYCENGAKAVAEEATKKRITPAFFREWSVEALSKKSDYWLGKQGRLTYPMVLRRGSSHYEPISWEDAFRLIADQLNVLDSPAEAIFYTSGRTSNEAAFLYQLFVRLFGTNNLPDCSNLCHESSGMGLKEVIGIGKGTVTLGDFEKAELIFVVGQNPGTNHPRMLTTLQKAKRAGAKIVHVNPLPEAGLKRFRHPQEVFGWLGKGDQLADVFVQIRINGDVAFFKGMMKHLLHEEARHPREVLARQFIKQKTEGLWAFGEDLLGESWEVIVEESGISREQIEQVAQMVIEAERIIVCWAMGLTQHKNAVGNIQSIVNLLLMRGAIGKPGAGVCPVRGHSNVQGDRTVGITPRPSEAFLDRLGEAFDFEPPRAPGYDTVEAIKAMHEGKASVFFAMGGNFLSASPDTEYTAEALQRCRLTVQVSTKLNRAHLVTGAQALILPCLGRTERDVQVGGEQFVSVENSMGIVHASQGTLEPASIDLRSEPAIVAGLADATLGVGTPVDWDTLVADYDRVREFIAQVIPGFEDYNRRVREPNGFYLPNAARDGVFNTDTGKAKFTIHPIPRHGLEAGQFLMMTVRSHDQYNTTIYGLDDRYRGVKGERRVIFMNPDDAREAGYEQGDVVDLISHYQGEERLARRFVVVPFSLPRRCTATYFPEANPLVPVDHTADKSNTPASKSVVISLRPASNPATFDSDDEAADHPGEQPL